MSNKCKNKKCNNSAMEGKKYCEHHQSNIDNLVKSASKLGILVVGVGVRVLTRKKLPMK